MYSQPRRPLQHARIPGPLPPTTCTPTHSLGYTPVELDVQNGCNVDHEGDEAREDHGSNERVLISLCGLRDRERNDAQVGVVKARSAIPDTAADFYIVHAGVKHKLVRHREC